MPHGKPHTQSNVTLGELFQRELIGPDPEGTVRGDVLPVVRSPEGEFRPGVPGAAQDLFRSVGRFAKGLRGEGEVGISDVANIAGAGAVGGLGAARAGAVPPNALGLFGSGKLASKGQRAKAHFMEKAGESPKEINRATGMSRGADGRWRIEIPDDAAFIRKPKQKINKVGELLIHPRLYTYYPDIPEMPLFGFTPGRGNNYPKNAQALYHPPWGSRPEHIALNTSQRLSPIRTKSLILHEMQHAIQHREGFGTGGAGTKAFVRQAADALIKKAEAAGDKAKADDMRNKLASFNSLTDAQQQTQAAIFYNRMAGEVEARNVERRQGLSRNERRQSLPEETEDVPRDKQIVLTDQELAQGIASFILGVE